MTQYREHASAEGRFLLLAIRGRRSPEQTEALGELYRSIGPRSALSAAARNHVLELVADAVLTEDLAGTEVEIWRAVLELNARRVERMESVVASLVNAVALPVALFESAGVLFASDLPRRAFGSGDFDLLVLREHASSVVAELGRCGFQEELRGGRAAGTRRELRSPDGEKDRFWLDVATKPFERSGAALTYDDPTARWLERAVSSRKNHALNVLAPSDLLAMVAVHTSLHSFVRSPGLRLHVDVDRTVRDNAIDWPAFLREVGALGMRRRAFVSLVLAAGLLDTPIPSEVLSELFPGSVRWRVMRELLEKTGVVRSEDERWTLLKHVILDLAVDDSSPATWALRLAFPPAEWLAEQSDATGRDASLLKLHLERVRRLVSRWSEGAG